MKQYPWISGVLWDIVEFSIEKGLTDVAKVLLTAISEIEQVTGSDPSNRSQSQQEGLLRLLDAQEPVPATAEPRIPVLEKSPWEQ